MRPAGPLRGAAGPHQGQAGGRPRHRQLAGTDQADLAVSTQSLPRGVASVHMLPAGHHDGPWDSIVVPDGTRERLLGTALGAMLHGRRPAPPPAPPTGP